MDLTEVIASIREEMERHRREVSLIAAGCQEIIDLIDGIQPQLPPQRRHFREYKDDVLKVIADAGAEGLLTEQIAEAVLGRSDWNTRVGLFTTVIQPLKNEGIVEVCGIRCYRLNPLYNPSRSV